MQEFTITETPNEDNRIREDLEGLDDGAHFQYSPFSWSDALSEISSLKSITDVLENCQSLPFTFSEDDWTESFEALVLLGKCSILYSQSNKRPIVPDHDEEEDVMENLRLDFTTLLPSGQKDSLVKSIDREERPPLERTPAQTKNESLYIQPLRSADSETVMSLLKERFNYASTDCAASVLASPKGSSFVSSILNSNKDQYMLVPCSAINLKDARAIVIELCQDIQINHIILANLEYFSSTIRKFKLYVNNRYPGDPKHPWQWIGSFETLNLRELQASIISDHCMIDQFTYSWP